MQLLQVGPPLANEPCLQGPQKLVTLQLAHSQVGCLVPAAADEAQGREAAVFHASSCLPAQICWQITDALHSISVLVLVLVWGGHGPAEGSHQTACSSRSKTVKLLHTQVVGAWIKVPGTKVCICSCTGTATQGERTACLQTCVT